MVRACAIAILSALLAAASAANAGFVLNLVGTGSVAPDPSCPLPPTPPFDCPQTATGTEVDTTGTFGPWNFTSPFVVFSASPVGPTQFRNGGSLVYDDTSPANNDLFGTFTGVFDFATFTAVHNVVITGGTGAFADASGFGTVFVEVNPETLTYRTRGQLVIPLPSTLALLSIAVLAFAGTARRRP